ncbi:MAG TPA: M1 family aminopeptidase, partial [Bryobacteraceae bacterium]|nr:M1 family aminopeptidase [Bryobacteraceae bacterium]
MMKYTATLFLICIWCIRADAQSAPGAASSTAATPSELAKLVLQRFATGSAQEFDDSVPDPGAQGVVSAAIRRNATRVSNLGQVIWSGPERAVLLLTGTVADKSSSSETIRSRHFSGLYEAVKSEKGWSISRQLPFDTGNHILSHTVDATIVPTQSIAVKDTLDITADNEYGFAVRLNDRAELSTVTLNGEPVQYAFGGGVLWFQSPQRRKAKLFLAYTLAEDRDSKGPPKDAAAKLEAQNYGSFANADVWLPIFDFDSANGTGDFQITVRLPAAYYLTTSISQTESVENAVRTIVGHSDIPAFALTLIYDSGWRPTIAKIGSFQFATFLTPEFKWSPELLGKQVREVFDLLSPRFGNPQGTYFAVAEQRDIGVSGFRYRSNDLVVSGQGGGKQLMSPASEAASGPNAPFAHEVSHGWTMQATGPAANFLREGWATWCEWMFVGEQYGSDVAHGIWQTAYNYYILGAHNGAHSILGNPDNGSVHYTKGAWIYHMLEETMGRQAFDRGMREYIQIPRSQPAGYQDFITAMSHAAGRDMSSFIMPWIAGKYIPDLDAQVEGSHIIVTQRQPDIFSDLPLQLTYETASGTMAPTSIHITGKVTTLDTGNPRPIRNVRIDPDHQFLLLRHLGENVSFELRAPAAKTVALSGNFSLKPVPAVRNGDVWKVEIPMVNGRYSWAWQIDGKTAEPDSSYEGQAMTGV